MENKNLIFFHKKIGKPRKRPNFGKKSDKIFSNICQPKFYQYFYFAIKFEFRPKYQFLAKIKILGIQFLFSINILDFRILHEKINFNPF